jgi:flagellar biosynthesis/type III secretory pathway protein FliH
MSLIVLHADRFATVLAVDPVIPAAGRPALDDALALLAEARSVREAATASADADRQRGFDEGKAEGLALGRQEAADEHRAELFRLAMRDGEERRARQAEMSALALEIVRRVAGDLGDDTVVAALAERAARDVAPDTVALVRVAPANHVAVAARLRDRPGLSVEPDDTIGPRDCVVETSLGRTHAGLDTQLAQIEAVWAGKSDG